MEKRGKHGIRFIIFWGCFLFLSQALIGLRAEDKYPRYYFSFSYMQGKMAVGDLNTYLVTFNNNDLFKYIRENNPTWGEVQGNILPLSGKYAIWDIELLMEINPKIRIGFSTHSPQGKKKLDRLVYIMREPGATTGITYTIYSGYMNYSPLEFSVSYNLWERKKISLSLGVGTGIYRATISRHIYMDIYTSNESGSKRSPIRRILESGRPYLPALGGFGNVSVKYAVSSRLSFIAEAKARYGKISNFKGSEFSLYIDDNGNIGYNEYKGKLWFYPTNIDYWIGTSYSQLEISPVKPDMVWLSESILENIRKANLNLTCLSFGIGLKIRLF